MPGCTDGGPIDRRCPASDSPLGFLISILIAVPPKLLGSRPDLAARMSTVPEPALGTRPRSVVERYGRLGVRKTCRWRVHDRAWGSGRYERDDRSVDGLDVASVRER
jgi:hypothetical protein